MHRVLTSAVVLLMLFAGAVGLGSQQPASVFQPAEIVSVVEPTYPINSVAFGTVIFEVHLDEAGAIADVRVVNDIPPLTRQAQQALAQWKFRPARWNGRPVPSVLPVAFTFVRPDLWPRLGGGAPKP